MDPKQFTYTIKWTQSPSTWNLKMFDTAKRQAYELEEKIIETMVDRSNLTEAKQVLDKIFKRD